ncbi:hypothetical protein O9993_14785 [Vibrio lentus]|nr:hypothetical protein [Vibrio lentus]
MATEFTHMFEKAKVNSNNCAVMAVGSYPFTFCALSHGSHLVSDKRSCSISAANSSTSFGTTLYPQDLNATRHPLHDCGVWLILSNPILFLGRVWCGYLRPQTV